MSQRIPQKMLAALNRSQEKLLNSASQEFQFKLEEIKRVHNPLIVKEIPFDSKAYQNLKHRVFMQTSLSGPTASQKLRHLLLQSGKTVSKKTPSLLLVCKANPQLFQL